MSINSPTHHRPRVVFFGMNCASSAIPLGHLLDAGANVVAIVMDESLRPYSDHTGASVVEIAGQENIPILSVTTLAGGSRDLEAISAYQPDLIAVSCFPIRLPHALLTLPPLGCLNVHPSLLPLGRGPEPVFWTLRRGERRTGVTIHLMDEGFDTGPILLQEEVLVPSGIRATDLERELAERGGALLVEALSAMASGSLSPRPQDDTRATYAPVPSERDYIVPTNLPARWAYEFVRGVSPLGGPLSVGIVSSAERFRVVDALDWNDQHLTTPYHITRETLTVGFRDGTVVFKAPCL